MIPRFLAPWLLLLAACQQLPTATAPESPMPVLIAAQSETAMQLGQIMEITLEANPSTGYQWQLVEDGQPQLVKTEVPIATQTAAERPMPGAPGTMRLHLQAVRTGSCDVVLEYRRPWETDMPPAATARYRVSVR